MKGVIISFLAVTAVAMAIPAGESHYTDKYDNVNLDEVLGNKRLLEGYIKCVLDTGKCTPDGKELKTHIVDGLETDCAKCTPTQRSGTDRTMKHLINFEPVYWDQLKNKYDPTGKFSKKYEERLRTTKA